jgi:DNA-directed RNA polymerase specialized sigma24 family protein
MAGKLALWPALETGYDEEFGPVDPEVHRVARDLWPRAEHFALGLLHDRVAGYRLLKRAVAALSGLSAERRTEIRDPTAYLFQTYKRLVLTELEKRHSHRIREVQAAELCRSPGDAERIDRDILVAELVRGMDSWTRQVFEAQVLGYSFHEIGRAMGTNPHVVRNRFRLALRRLAATVKKNRAIRVRVLNPSTW